MELDRNPQKVLSIDFDGVLHRYGKGWQDGTIYDEPVEGCQDALSRLVESGYRIVISTARLEHGDKAEIITWLFENGMFIGVHYHDITDKKVSAVAYIDDRAVRFTNWSDILKYFAWTR